MSTADGTTTLADLLAQAEAGHADHPAATVAGLLDCAPLLLPDLQAAQALRLAEHVALAHLGDANPLAALLGALPPTLLQHTSTAAAVQRLRWVWAMASGATAADPPPDATRWHALQNLVLALAAQARWADAAALLATDEAAARAHGAGEAGVAYAVSANNVAMELQTSSPPEGRPRVAARDALMLQAASTARRAWGHAGTWRHVERAEYRLALCHAVAGHGALAVQHACLCLAGCKAAGAAADALEHFFAHEALARAQRVAGDAVAARAARDQMTRLLPHIDAAAGLRAWCAEQLAALPV